MTAKERNVEIRKILSDQGLHPWFKIHSDKRKEGRRIKITVMEEEGEISSNSRISVLRKVSALLKQNGWPHHSVGWWRSGRIISLSIFLREG